MTSPFLYRKKSEAKVLPPLHNDSRNRFMIGRTFGNIFVTKLISSDGFHYNLFVYTYRSDKHTYTVTYNSTTHINTKVGWGGCWGNYYVFYIVVIDEYKLYNYKSGNFTGRLLFADEQLCHRSAGGIGLHLDIYAYRKCKAPLEQDANWRFYRYNYTRGKGDTLTLILFHQISDMKQPVFAIFFVSAVAFIFLSSYEYYYVIRHYPLQKGHNKPRIFLIVSKNIHAILPGYNILFGISFRQRSSYVVVIPCLNTIKKGLKYYYKPVLLPLHLKPLLRYKNLRINTEIFIEKSHVRVLQQRKWHTHAVAFYYLESPDIRALGFLND
jgi:hypothetical protein